MSRHHYTGDDIEYSLKELGLKNGDKVFVHSNIGFFGSLQNASAEEDYYRIFRNAIFNLIGKEGTLVVPVFTYSYTRGEVFDPEFTPSTMGLFSEMLRKDPESLRSVDPNFSVAAIGRNALEFTQDPPKYSFGKDSFWERFMKADGKIVNFNFDAASTMIHYAEREIEVPYRYDKGFWGKTSIGGSQSEAVFYHFVYDIKKPEHRPDFEGFDRLAKEMGYACTQDLGRGQIVCISARDTFKLIKENISTNPSLLIVGNEVEAEPKAIIASIFKRLWPVNRSLTGEGNRESLRILSELCDLEVREVPSGIQCYDWEVPAEWNVSEAWVMDPEGSKIIDFNENNIHLLGYSIPFEGEMSLAELSQHLYTLPDMPEAIPYLTSYYSEKWGFCISQNQKEQLKDGMYEVCIKSSLDKKGSMSVGEKIIRGKTNEEVLLSTYICHPSLANDNLSGMICSAMVCHELLKMGTPRYTYRFVFLPETIGSIYYLHKNGEKMSEQCRAGYVLTTLGDRGKFTYKRSRTGNTLSDRAAELFLSQLGEDYLIENFFPSGSDERQYCSPGFNLPVGSLMRTRYARYKEYHTSFDNEDVICFEKLEETVKAYLELINILETNRKYINKNPYCEPRLSKRGLYNKVGSQKVVEDLVAAYLWVLNYSDGDNDLIDIARISELPYRLIVTASDQLVEKGMLEERL